MKLKQLIRVAGLAAVCLGGTAFAGISWADASSATHKQQAGPGKVCTRWDGDDPVRCLGPAPRGHRGQRGPAGFTGAVGPVGAVGITGPLGAVGQVGQQGARGGVGAVGATGPTGPDGAFYQDPTNPNNHGADAGGSTLTVVGPASTPITLNQNADGTELPPAVAHCPKTGYDTEAYDGGVIIKTTDSGGNPSQDIVAPESSYPGTLNGQNEVDPIPVGANEAANAYEARAVVSYVAQNLDRVTLQAYVVCGP